jgi:cell division protein FtsB
MCFLSGFLRLDMLTLIFAVLFTGVGLDAVYGPSGLLDLLLLRQHSRALVAERHQLVRENRDLLERIARLKSDDAFLQQLIRQDLGYAKSGEVVYRFPKEVR